MSNAIQGTTVNSWSEQKIGDLCKLINGRAFRPTEWTDQGLPIIRIQNLNDETKPFNYFNGPIDQRHRVNDGDVLISWSGTPGTSFGAFLWDRGEAVLNQHIFRVDLDQSKCLKEYFVYAVNWRLDELIYRAHGGVGLRHITKTELEKVSIPIPYSGDASYSLYVQQWIVDWIKSLFNDLKTTQSLVDEMHTDILQLLPATYNEVYEKLEPRMQMIPLSKVAVAMNGRASGEGDSAIRVFKTKHVYPHTLRLDRPSFLKIEQVKKIPRDRFLQRGDVLMANIAEGTLGRVTYVADCEESWTVDTQIMILRPLDQSNSLLGRWLYYYLWSERGQKEILARRTGIAFAEKRGQTHIYPRNIRDIPLPIIPIHMQRQAISHLAAIEADVENMRQTQEQNKQALMEAKHSILDLAFRGKAKQ